MLYLSKTCTNICHCYEGGNGEIGEENLPGSGAHREKWNEEGSITLRLFEKVMGNNIILCLLKITCNVYI